MPVGIFKDFLHGVYTAFKLAKEIELEQSDPFAFFNSEFFPTRFSFGLSALSSCKYKSAVMFCTACSEAYFFSLWLIHRDFSFQYS